MAELSITPKKITKVPNLILDKNFNLKSEIRERKRNVLYLIHAYLTERKMKATVEALEAEAEISDQYKVCENVDLEIILQEYQSYYHTKFQKYPQILRKVEEGENKLKKKDSAKLRSVNTAKEKCINDQQSGQSEPEEFQFEIISLSSETTQIKQHPTDKPLCDLPNYSSEWREIADQILKESFVKNLETTWSDCVGLQSAVEQLKEAVIYPRIYPDIFKNLSSWKGILLFGPPGTGKTLLAKALVAESSTFINVTAATFVSKWRGESEKMITVLFDLAKHYAPTTIFIDEIDALASSSDALNHDASRRFKSELLIQMDGLNSEKDVFVLGSTNAPWNLDPAMLRRFERRILIQMPDNEAKIGIFKYYLKRFGIGCENEKIVDEIVQNRAALENFSGADIKVLCKSIALSLAREKMREVEKKGTIKKSGSEFRKVNQDDIDRAIKKIKPCSNDKDIKKYQEWAKKFGSY